MGHKCICLGLVSRTEEDFKRLIFRFNSELFFMTFVGLQGPKQVHVAELEH